MKYLLMIYGNETVDLQKSPEEQKAEIDAYSVFTDELVAAGLMRSGEALHPSTTATTVRVRDGKIATTDGPFAETKEQLGGYYVVECKNLDEAIEWAAKIPHASQEAVEVRPILDFDEMRLQG